jgi:hypothetical protein
MKTRTVANTVDTVANSPPLKVFIDMQAVNLCNTLSNAIL